MCRDGISVAKGGEWKSLMPMPATNSLTHNEISEPAKETPTPQDPRAPGQKSKSRKKFTAAEKLRIVKAAAACARGELAALLRREGIYSSHLTTWRQQLGMHGAAGLEPKKAGRKKTRDDRDKRIAELERKLRRAHAQLEIAQDLIELQKKAQKLLAADDDDES
jgi:transposase